MNKKFSTLLVGLALTTAFSANAADPVDKQLHQLKVGDKYLSVTKSKVNTSADSLILVSEDKVGEDVMKDSYKKSLWKLTKGNTDNTQDLVWTLTNWATGNVLSLDLTKSTTTFAEGKQSKWLIADNGNIKAISGGKVYALYTEDVKDKDGNVVGEALKIGKDKTFADFVYTQPAVKEALSVSEINGLYGTSSVFDFEKDLNGNPIDGVAINAVSIKDETNGFVNIRLNNGKYLVVDSAKWTNSVNNNSYWKLTTDALPTAFADEDEKSTDLADVALLENGRSADFYAFKIKLNIAEGYKMTIYPKAVPVYKNSNEENGKQTAFSYGTETTSRALVYGKFADSKEVLAATSTVASNDKLQDAVATFGVVEAPDALDTDYTYYVQFYNKKKVSTETGNWIADANYNKYVYTACDESKAYAKASVEAPAYMWYLDETTGELKNMIVTTESYEGFITLINEENGVYAFGTDTLKLTKGPKVKDAQKMGYKVVTKADEVNGALSFRLVSLLADDLYMVSKDGVMYVANSELTDAQKLKVVATETPNEDGEIEYATVGNNVVKPVYNITDRLGKKVLVLKNEKFVLVDKDSEGVAPLAVSFLSMGKNNQYKIVYNDNNAITANAASGILAETTLCDNQNVIFEFATQEAPAYGAPAIGHVQISTMEDDNKVIANQKDGFAALKAEGQSILKSDVYTQDTLTMWLDTACVTFDETMPLYYISTKTFNAEAETRNFLINPANISAAINKNNEDPDATEIEDIYDYASVAGENTYRAAFVAASVCGLDSIAIDGDTIGLMQLNPAAIAFEVAAEISDEAYRIVSKLHAVNDEYDAEDEESLPYEETAETLYLAQLNNVLFWTADQAKAEIFVINRASTPTANEGIEAESTVNVIAGNGTVTVQGAAGQTVTIATVLGKVVANEVVASDNATIAAPAGVVFVTVNGETTKVVVK
ncbi:DUF6383 domain-containing protein [Parabacteroides sp.]|uniref:DUF6383 domain-containing protein n=1 Tax=Parabacteroides sp. TaxID=1869337 RepID=UPI00257DFD36|nr:DUF6383 domain-containing protein [Parabacteroides sp.]